MNTARMMEQIETAIADERRSHGLRGIMTQVAQLYGRRPSGKELDQAVQFVIDYIKHVPGLLREMDAAAKKRGAPASIRPLLDACQQYWDEGFDIIPDHLGLVGYTDDAYYVLSIIQAISDAHRETNGAPLLDIQLTPMNQTMRGLIGEPHATILDSAILTALGVPAFNDLLRTLTGFRQPLVDRDPIWGNASIDDIVKNQMGALGIV